MCIRDSPFFLEFLNTVLCLYYVLLCRLNALAPLLVKWVYGFVGNSGDTAFQTVGSVFLRTAFRDINGVFRFFFGLDKGCLLYTSVPHLRHFLINKSSVSFYGFPAVKPPRYVLSLKAVSYTHLFRSRQTRWICRYNFFPYSKG